MTSPTPAAGTPQPDPVDAVAVDTGGGATADPPPDPDEDGRRGVAARAAAWLAPTPSELLALAILLLGSVVASLTWWYGSVTAPVGPAPAAMAGAALGERADLGSQGDFGEQGDDAPAVGTPQHPAADTGQPDADTAAAQAGAGAAGGTAARTDPVLVHVSGAVQRPGLVTLSADARVGDAVDAAGGLTEDADGDRINLARVLVDGEQVHVPAEGEELPPAATGERGAVPGSDAPAGGGDGLDPQGRIDLNRATAAELESLPGIGPARATAIVDHREQHGPFGVPGDLRAVSGIGEATFQNLAPLIVVR